MPTSEPMTPGEIARTLRSVESKLDRLDTKLDHRPTWTEIERLAKSYEATVTEQFRLRDSRLDSLEEDLCQLQEAQRKVGWAVFSAVIMALVSVVIGVPPVL